MGMQKYIESFYPNLNMSWNDDSWESTNIVFNTLVRRDSGRFSGRFPVKRFESVIRKAYKFFGFKEGRDFIIIRDANNQAVRIQGRRYSLDIDTAIYDYLCVMRAALEKGKRKAG